MSAQDDERTPAFQDITARVTYHKIPEDGFDPRDVVDPTVLREYGIPPRPTGNDPAGCWDEMFARPLRFAKPSFRLRRVHTRVTSRLYLSLRARSESSLNWSGALITPRNGQQFTEVYGRWQVPSVSVPMGMPNTTEYRSSVWVGLDGSRQYFDSTLPQIGSAQEWDPVSSGPLYYLWWQWWMRDNPLTWEPCILPIDVNAEDRIVASLLVLDETHVQFHISNLSTGLSYPSFTMEAPRHYVTNQQAKVSGGTAEWIVERPSDPATGPYELPDYGEVEFTNCSAVQATLPPGGTPGIGTIRTLTGSKVISMYRIGGTPQRRRTISRPQTPRVDGVKVEYVGP